MGRRGFSTVPGTGPPAGPRMLLFPFHACHDPVVAGKHRFPSAATDGASPSDAGSGRGARASGGLRHLSHGAARGRGYWHEQGSVHDPCRPWSRGSQKACKACAASARVATLSRVGAIIVREAKALFLAYKEAGLDFRQAYREQPCGAHDFIVSDPDGNLIHFASRVGDRRGVAIGRAAHPAGMSNSRWMSSGSSSNRAASTSSVTRAPRRR